MSNNDITIFSKNLNTLMRKNGKEQIDLINDLGLNRSTVSTWCRGVKMPRMATILTLADYFNVNVSDLVDDKPIERDTDSELKVALFGGDGEVTDEMWQEVKNFAQYIKNQRKNGLDENK